MDIRSYWREKYRQRQEAKGRTVNPTPGRPPKLTAETMLQMVDEIHRSSEHLKVIAAKYGVSEGTARRYAARSGVRRRPKVVPQALVVRQDNAGEWWETGTREVI